MEKFLPTYERIFGEKYEKTVSCEAVLPEYLPNISRIVRVSALTGAGTNEAENGTVSVRGRAVFAVIYASDFGDALKCAVFPCDFSHEFRDNGALAGISDGGFTECTVQVSDEKAQLISPRKLSLSCTASIVFEATAMKKNEVFSPEEDGNLRKLEKTVSVLGVRPLENADIHIDETIELESGMPHIREMIFADCSLCMEKAEIHGGICRMSGSADVCCMYLGEDSGEGSEYVAFSKCIPFSCEVPAADINEESVVIMKPCVTGISADAVTDNYGESGSAALRISGIVSAKAYCNTALEVCEDVFCTKHDCACDVRAINADVLVQGLSGKSEVSESVHANIGNITEITAQSMTAAVLSTELIDSKVVVSARATLRLCAVNELGGMESTAAVFGFKTAYRDNFESMHEKYKFDTSIGIENLRCRLENGEIRCDFTASMNTAAVGRSPVYAVTGIELDDSSEFARDKSEYVLYYPDAADTVWSCAKKYKVSPKELMELNGMKDERELAGRRTLIIPR